LIPLTATMQSLLKVKVHRHCKCWKITRTDATVLRFTTASEEITFNSELYTPVGGANDVAQNKETGLKETDTEFAGMITSDAITTEDLVAGRYRGAIIEEWVVDYMYPFLGHFDSTVYEVHNTTYDGEVWQTEVVGLFGKLQERVGRNATRTCPNIYDDDSGCDFATVNPGSQTEWTNVDVVSVSPTYPKGGFLGHYVDLPGSGNWFAYGIVTFTSGNNSGLHRIIKYYGATEPPATFWFEAILPFPYDVEVGDLFTAKVGCCRQMQNIDAGTTCLDCEDHLMGAYHGGYPHMPGTDKMIKTPQSKG
jgi:uncharacterized phage protein (TIGR02218 family)